MNVIQQQLDDFYQFAQRQIHVSPPDCTLAGLFAEWRNRQAGVDAPEEGEPTPQELHENALAVKAALRDIELGEQGRPFAEFATEFRQRNQIPADQ